MGDIENEPISSVELSVSVATARRQLDVAGRGASTTVSPF